MENGALETRRYAPTKKSSTKPLKLLRPANSIEEHMKENAEDAEDEDAVRARMFEDFENDRLQEDVDDVSIWKHPGHDKRRDSWRKTLLSEAATPLTPAVPRILRENFQRYHPILPRRNARTY